MNTILTVWFCCGFWWLMKSASKEQLAEMENPWQRRCALILTLPLWLLVFVFISMLPQMFVCLRDSWNGKPKDWDIKAEEETE